MAEDTAYAHILKNLFFILWSSTFFVIDTAVILTISIRNKLGSNVLQKERIQEVAVKDRKTVLITGVSTAQGLELARLFHRRGHRVVAADNCTFSVGYVSSAIDKLYWLSMPSSVQDSETKEEAEEEERDDPYSFRLLHIVDKESVDLWVSISDDETSLLDARARDLIEACSEVKCVQLSAKDTTRLQDQGTFIRHAKSLGLSVPDTAFITTRASVIDLLRKKHGLSLAPNMPCYILKALETNATGPRGKGDRAPLALPLATEQETLRAVESAVPLENAAPFILQERINGSSYSTDALIVRGQVRAFVACPYSDHFMHYTALPPESSLSQSMLDYTRRLAEAAGPDFTGHVGFTFIAQSGQDTEATQIFAVKCNPRLSPAGVLFSDTTELVAEYLDVIFRPQFPQTNHHQPISPLRPREYYWIGQDVVEYVILPPCQALVLRTLTWSQVWAGWGTCIQHVRYWKDATLREWDPWPWWWLYHVYWPLQFLGYLFCGRWYVVSCSTGRALK